MVVFPTPGGPHKIMEGMLPLLIAFLITPVGPVRCSCPTRSSSLEGRIRSAKGEWELISMPDLYSSNNENTENVQEEGASAKILMNGL